MEICSLRNGNLLSRCVYSDIVNRKFPPKKPFRPESSDCAECVTFSLPRIKFLSDGQQQEARPLPLLLSYFEKIAHMSVVQAYVSLWLCGSVALWLCMLGCLLQEPIRLKVL